MLRKIALLLNRLNELHIEQQIVTVEGDIIELAKIKKEQDSIYLNFNQLLIDTL
jgi:hypothetical protein